MTRPPAPPLQPVWMPPWLRHGGHHALRRARWLFAAVLVVCLPLQGLQLVMAQSAMPAHVHLARAGSAVAPATGGATSYDRLAVALAAMEGAARTRVQPTVALRASPFSEADLRPHAHPLAQAGVVYLASEAQAPGAPRGSAKLPLADGALRAVALSLPPPAGVMQPFARVAGDAYRSHIDAPPQRPPRAKLFG